MRPFRFGLSLGGTGGREDFLAAVRRAEAVGFDVIASADHIGRRLAVLPMLATAAEISSLRLSPMVMANDYRHPVILAKEAATIDALSGGRLELGIGTGWIEEQYTAAGIPYDPPGIKVERLEEAINVIKGCWSGEPFTFTGEHYRVKNVTCPRPTAEPRPPILIGAAGPRMLRLAGREADIVGISVTSGISGFDHFGAAVASSGDQIESQLSWIRDGARSRFEELELSVMAHHVALGEDAEALATEIAEETGTSRRQVLGSPHVLLGPPERIADTLVERRERYGISYIVFLDRDLDLVAPVVERLAGG